MEFFKKRRNAWFVTLLIIILVTVVSAGSSLNKLRKQADNVFYNGEGMDGMGIQHDLDMIMSYCSNLTVVASRYMDKEHDLVKAVNNNKDALEAAETPDKKYQGAQNLFQSVTELYVYMGDLHLSEKDQDFHDSIYADIESRYIIISRSTYNQYAKEFNIIRNRFPANILSAITSVPALELYE